MIPNDTLSEVLKYLVDHEEFKSIDSLESISRNDVRVALLRLADKLDEESKAEQEETLQNFQNFEELSVKVKTLLSNLSPGECKKLFKQFGLGN